MCGSYRTYRICGMGPPSSGQVAVQQIMGVLETQDMASLKPGPDAVHWIAEAGRLAYADRALFLADPAFVNVPVKGLTDPGYIKTARIGRPEQVHGQGQARRSALPEDLLWGPSEGVEFGTSHISIVDRNGNAVSMTTDRGWVRRHGHDEAASCSTTS